MTKIDFVKKLYNGKNCYSDHMDESELQLIHIASNVEKIIIDMLAHNRIVFLTGNPGDGKTFIIKTISSIVDEGAFYIQTDLNNIKDYTQVIKDIVSLYEEKKEQLLLLMNIHLCNFVNKLSWHLEKYMMKYSMLKRLL